jgi:hypothetical protein
MRKGRNEVEARGGKKANPDSPYDHSNHAEVKAIEMATGNGLEIVEVFASRPACWKCRQMRGRLGIPITDPN